MHGRGKARVGDHDGDMELPWSDVRVCVMLCVGGPCKYQLRHDSGVSYDLILNNIVSNIKK